MTIKHIDFNEFVNISGVKETTIKRNYKRIPGITKDGENFIVLSGTRYPYNIRNTKLKNSYDRRYTLLKAISAYKYISNKELGLEPEQFEAMLNEFSSAGLIKKNYLSNTYGANAYDCTPLGDELLKKRSKEAKQELASLFGIFTDAVISQIYNAS